MRVGRRTLGGPRDFRRAACISPPPPNMETMVIPRRTPGSHPVAALVLAFVLGACGGSDSTGPDGGGPTNNVLAISAGGSHSCALRTDGVAFCWGQNTSGQLGDGTTDNSSTPVRVDTDLTFRAISAGDTHTCALTAANDAYCWGDNVHGQVGGGAAAEINLPPTLVSATKFSSISAGMDHSCGIATNLTAWCWGQALLGDGPTRTRRATPVQVTGGNYNAISAAANFTCALTTTGAARCWGQGAGGTLGNGAEDEEDQPQAVSGDRSYTAISAGIGHVCAIQATTSDAWCWGANNVGQLGPDSVNAKSLAPVKVAGDRDWLAIDASELHSCGVASNGTWCWGRNTVGQLGTNDLDQRDAPAAVADGILLERVSSFRGHTCGTGTGSRAWCWGANAFGQVGTGGTSARVQRPHAIRLPDEDDEPTS